MISIVFSNCTRTIPQNVPTRRRLRNSVAIITISPNRGNALMARNDIMKVRRPTNSIRAKA
ncbi:hypothetical protein D3C71_2113080 [compost metagenome]